MRLRPCWFRGGSPTITTPHRKVTVKRRHLPLPPQDATAALKILVIEDNPADFQLLERQIRVQGLSAECRRVGTPAELEAALQCGWDLVLTDYNVPGMDFREHLALIQSRRPDLPVILVSGSLGEETAVELLRLGLADFVLKGHPARLSSSILRALHENKEHLARLNAETELRASEEQLKLALSATQEVVWDWDIATGMVKHNERWLDLLGVTDQLMTHSASSFFNLVHPDDLERVRAQIEDAHHGQGHYSEEYRLRHAAGHYLWVSSHGRVVARDAQGHPLRMVGAFADVTQRKTAEKQLRKLSLAVEQSPESILIANLAGEIEYVNGTFTQNTGYTQEEVIGKTPRLMRSGKTPPETYKALWRALGQGQSWKGEFINRRKDGSEYVELAIITPLRNEDGRFTHYVAVQKDITEKKRLAEELDRHRYHLEELVSSRTVELEAARVQADAANQAKSALLANMSHEIRTPMNAIIGLTELCLDSAADATLRGHLHNVARAAELLKDLINDILDLSKIEAGAMQLERKAFALEPLLDRIVGTVEVLARAKNLDLKLDIAPDIPDLLEGDALRLGQVLLNLCSNAIKFTRAGSIHVRCGLESREAQAASLHFSVKDTGIGMSTEVQQRIFAPFVQADTSTTREHGGTGLGLTISNKLVTLMGGRLWVESVPGAGSHFHFTARLGLGAIPAQPLPPRMPARAGTGPAAPLAGYRILVADDNELNAEVARSVLEYCGCQAVSVGNGREAIARLNESTFDAILMDIQMPVMDGIMATREIRRDPRHAKLPIIAFTANVMGENRDECLAAGMDDFITKPFVRGELLALLHKHLDGRRPGFAGEAAPPPAAPPLPDVAGFDVASALARIEGDVDQYRHCLRLFRDRNEASVSAIRDAMNRGDAKAARLLAHSLKGGAGTVGAVKVQEAAARLEASLKISTIDTLLLKAVEGAWEQALASLAGLLEFPTKTQDQSGVTQHE